MKNNKLICAVGSFVYMALAMGVYIVLSCSIGHFLPMGSFIQWLGGPSSTIATILFVVALAIEAVLVYCIWCFFYVKCIENNASHWIKAKSFFNSTACIVLILIVDLALPMCLATTATAYDREVRITQDLDTKTEIVKETIDISQDELEQIIIEYLKSKIDIDKDADVTIHLNFWIPPGRSVNRVYLTTEKSISDDPGRKCKTIEYRDCKPPE